MHFLQYILNFTVHPLANKMSEREGGRGRGGERWIRWSTACHSVYILLGISYIFSPFSLNDSLSEVNLSILPSKKKCCHSGAHWSHTCVTIYCDTLLSIDVSIWSILFHAFLSLWIEQKRFMLIIKAKWYPSIKLSGRIAALIPLKPSLCHLLVPNAVSCLSPIYAATQSPDQ